MYDMDGCTWVAVWDLVNRLLVNLDYVYRRHCGMGVDIDVQYGIPMLNRI